MSESLKETIQPWVIAQMLSFFNKAKSVEDLIGEGSPIMDDPGSGSKGGYGIGETVAQRILNHRNTLIPRFYRELSQLDGVEGLGEDKFNDLIYSFRLPAAELFKKTMTGEDGIMQSNWNLDFYSKTYEEEEFRLIGQNETALKVAVGEILKDWNQAQGKSREVGDLLPGLVNASYPDHYDLEDYARYAWALWFYRFDSDNWFSFDRVRQKIEEYFSIYWNQEDRIELYLMRGFDNGAWIRNGITRDDLPVTICYAERSVTAWTCELFD